MGRYTGRTAAGVLVIALAAAGVRAATPSSDVSRLPPEAARMHAAVRNTQPGELKWQQIPWRLDLEEGRRASREENRPLLLFVSADEPLENC
jgi:hypothetical protein